MRRSPRLLDFSHVRNIRPRRRSNGYSAADLRARLAHLPMRFSVARRIAALAPIVVALVSWFVVPSFASSYINPDARYQGIYGGSGRCVWDGARYRCPYSDYLAYGYFRLAEQGGGPSIDGYCMDLQKDHFTGDILDDTGAARPEVQWILSNFYPAPGYPAVDPYRLSSDADEAAAVQIAVWAWTNDSLDPAHMPQGSWPSSTRRGVAGSVSVIERAKEIYGVSKSAGGPWAANEGAPSMSLSLSDAHPLAGSTVTVTADVKTPTGAAYDGPAHTNGSTVPHVDFTASGATLSAGSANIDSGGHALVKVTVTDANFSVNAAAHDLLTRRGDILTPRNTADQRIGFPRFENHSASASVSGSPTKTTPTVTTQASAQSAMVGDQIHDTVVVSNSNGDTATATVDLWGPFASAPTDSSCTGTPAWKGTVDVKGDGTYQTAAFTVATAGYYTYQETLPGDTSHNAVTTPCAVSSETTLVSSPSTPTVSTQASVQSAMVGDTIHDTVVVGNAEGYDATATVTLWGPFDTAPTKDSCTGPNNPLGHAPAWTGTVDVKGNGSYQSGDFTVAKAGYYTYTETLPGDRTHNAVSTECGVAAETTLVSAPTTPNVTTQASEQSGTVGDQIHDTVVLSASNGYTGTVTVQLWGPFTTAPTASSCTGTPAWTGTVDVKGDGSYQSPGFTVQNAGYYVYTETLPADRTHNAVSTPCGVSSETTLIKPAPAGGVQPIAVGGVQGVSTPVTGLGDTGMMRTTITGVCLMISGLVILTGLRRRNPHAPRW